MDIRWLGHSCFRLTEGEISILTDPFPNSIGITMGEQQAEIITISNSHPNHSYIAGVLAPPCVLNGPGYYDLHGIYIQGIATTLGKNETTEQRNTAYRIEMGGISIVHLGDINAPLSNSRVESFTPLDVLLVPAGGICTSGTSDIVKIIRSLDPKIVVPMHYNIPNIDVELQSIDSLLQELGVTAPEPQTRLNITQSSLSEGLQISILEPSGNQ
jgi:L-ascorbate metabolism protein UlaG (beta-lactamase superfamily)